MSDSPIPWVSTSPEFDELWAGDTDSDLDPAVDKVPDTLRTIFAQQRRLMVNIWPKEIHSGLSIETEEHEWGHLDSRPVQARIHETYGHLVRELSEAMQHLDGSKSWKENPRITDREAFVEEMADSLHFFVELCILAGIDAESLFLAYFAKAIVNTSRIENSY